MATVTGLTAARMQEIIDATITDADVVGDNLILTLHDGSTINAGNVRGATGATGPTGSGIPKGASFPGSPANGDTFIRTDIVGNPIFVYSSASSSWIRTTRADRALVSRRAAVSVSTNSGTDVSWDHAISNADGLWVLGTNPDRFTAVRAGLYRLEANVWWNAASSNSEISINHYNSANVFQRGVISDSTSGSGQGQNAVFSAEMAAGDYLKVNFWNFSSTRSFGSADDRTQAAFVRISD